MTNSPEMKSYEDLKNDEGLKSEQQLQTLIKEIDDLKDNDSSNDKIDGIVTENQSKEGLVQKSLNEGLKNSLMKCDKSVVDVLVSELSKFRGKEGVDDLLKLLNDIQQKKYSEKLDSESNEAFNKFKSMIEGKNEDGSNTLNKLNSLSKSEMETVMALVKDPNNKAAVFDLYTKMDNVNKPENFKRTDRKNFDTVMDAIKDTYPELKEHGMDAVRKFQSEGIKDNNEGDKDKENKSEENKDEEKKDEENKEGEGNGGFDKNVEKKGARMNEERVKNINSFVGEENAFLKLDGDNLSYNMDNVKKFLGTINEDNFNKDFIKVGSDSRYAWLAATQIFMNENGNSLTVDGEYRWGGETYNAVLNFQKKYNGEHGNEEGFVKLKEDGIAGPKTLAKLLVDKTEEDQGDKQKEDQGDKQKEDQGDKKQEDQGDKQKENQGDKKQEDQQGEQIPDSPDLGEYGNSKMAGYPSENNITRGTADISTSGNVVNQGKQIEESVKTPEKSGIEGVGKFEGGKFIFNEGMEQTDDAGRSYITINNEKYTKFSDIGLSDGESGKVYQESKDGIYFGEVVGGKYTRSGSGTMLFSNGDTFVGNWENGSLNGEGTLTKVDGTKISGNWENGEFKGNNSMVAEKPVKIDESRIDYDNNLNAQILDSEVVSDNSQKGADNAGVDKSYDEAMQKKFEAITGVERDGTYSENQADADVSKIEASNLQG